MNGDLLIIIGKIILALIALATAGLTGYLTYLKLVREPRMLKDMQLDDNPTRCGVHQEAINTLKSRLDAFEEHNRDDHGKLYNQIGAVGTELARLSGRLNGGPKT